MKAAFKNPLVVIGGCIAVLLILVSIFAPALMPNDPLQTNYANALAPPGGGYPLGTDDVGRCVMSRLISGCRTTVGAAAIIEASVLAIGLLLGVLAGYFGKAIDAAVTVVIDILLAFPSLILALVIAGLLGSGLGNVMIAMIAVYWVEHARVARSMARSLRGRDFVKASIAAGSGPWDVIRLHILPHLLPNMLVYAALNMSSIIIGISSMSFIGLGATPPTPEWGKMLDEARAFMNTNPQMMVVTIACVFVSVACFQLLGEGLRDSLSPRNSQLGISKKRKRGKEGATC